MRVQMGEPKLEANGRYSISFEVIKCNRGVEYIANRVSSPAQFSTKQDALDGGSRVLDFLRASGCFPQHTAMIG